MARPKANQEGPTAKERLEEAFWASLDEAPYSALTVKSIAKRAKVNHNTFYYYYENIEDMVDQMFLANIPIGFINLLMGVILENRASFEDIEISEDMEQRFHRVRTLFNCGSADVIRKVRAVALTQWIKRLGIADDEITEGDKARIAFLWGGISSLMAAEQSSTIAGYIAALQDGIADAARMLVQRVAEDHGISASDLAQGNRLLEVNDEMMAALHFSKAPV